MSKENSKNNLGLRGKPKAGIPALVEKVCLRPYDGEVHGLPRPEPVHCCWARRKHPYAAREGPCGARRTAGMWSAVGNLPAVGRKVGNHRWACENWSMFPDAWLRSCQWDAARIWWGWVPWMSAPHTPGQPCNKSKKPTEVRKSKRSPFGYSVLPAPPTDEVLTWCQLQRRNA